MGIESSKVPLFFLHSKVIRVFNSCRITSVIKLYSYAFFLYIFVLCQSSIPKGVLEGPLGHETHQLFEHKFPSHKASLVPHARRRAAPKPRRLNWPPQPRHQKCGGRWQFRCNTKQPHSAPEIEITDCGPFFSLSRFTRQECFGFSHTKKTEETDTNSFFFLDSTRLPVLPLSISKSFLTNSFNK